MAGQQALALLMGVRILLSQPQAPGTQTPGACGWERVVRSPNPRKEFANANSLAAEEPHNHFSRHPPSPNQQVRGQIPQFHSALCGSSPLLSQLGCTTRH